MRWLTILAWLAGLGLIAGLIVHQGANDVVAALAIAGSGAPLVGAVYPGVLAADTLGWRVLLPENHRPGLIPLLGKRWIGSSVNGLLPVAQVGGEFVRARLLTRDGIAGPVAGASVVVDLTIGLLTQVAFALLGLVLLLGRFGGAHHLLELSLGLAVFGGLLLGFGFAQRQGLFLPLARAVEKIGRGQPWLRLAGSAAALDDEIQARYRDRRRLAICAAWRFLGWLWGSVEIWLAFALLDHPIGLAEAIILESLGQAVRSAGFAIPGGLGVQEIGLVAIGAWLGLAPDMTLAVALIKRARELAYGVPGLVAWSLLEGRRPAPPVQPRA